MRVFSVFSILLVLFLTSAASAHPSIENSMEVIVYRDHVAINARIALPEIDIERTIDDNGVGPVDATKLTKAIEEHGPYVAAHVHVKADGKPLTGKLVKTTPPEEPVAWEDFNQHEASYEIDYPIAGDPPKSLTIDQNLLEGFTRLGQGWNVNFMVRIRQETDAQFQQQLLTLQQNVEIPCAWPGTVTTSPDDIAPEPTPTAADTAPSSLHVTWNYVMHGLFHILTGYDHLLFVAALVLAANKLWDLVKVVSAFALAHTLTLTLAVLNIIRLPSWVVEPVIAGSIVFLALQNALFPRQARGKARLIVAFLFGLFHGLGFAGGLLETMQGMPTSNLVVALIAFTLGVELAHQMLIIPLYGLLRLMREHVFDAHPTPEVNKDLDEQIGMPIRVPLMVRLASFAISAAGMLYLVVALTER